MATEPTVHGTFPFGRPNTARPLRKPESGNVDALVVGVYPSAFHVAWTPPPSLDPRPAGKRRRPLISSLAVDVEPTVFWDGSHPDPNELLDAWKSAVGFDPDRHGTVAVGTNGPSGQQLPATVLEPLGLDPDRIAYTDAVPWYFVKTTKGSQGAAIAERFNPLASALDASPGTLPTRPSKRQLVDLATSEGREPSLRSEIVEIGAPLVITLGQEAIDALSAVADTLDGVQRRLRPEGYGGEGTGTIDKHSFAVRALAHPGFIRQTKHPEWRAALNSWTEDV